MKWLSITQFPINNTNCGVGKDGFEQGNKCSKGGGGGGGVTGALAAVADKVTSVTTKAGALLARGLGGKKGAEFADALEGKEPQPKDEMEDRGNKPYVRLTPAKEKSLGKQVWEKITGKKSSSILDEDAKDTDEELETHKKKQQERLAIVRKYKGQYKGEKYKKDSDAREKLLDSNIKEIEAEQERRKRVSNRRWTPIYNKG